MKVDFAHFDTVFIANPTEINQYNEGQAFQLYRDGKRVSEHVMRLINADCCMGFAKFEDPHRVCSKVKRGDVLKKEVVRDAYYVDPEYDDFK
jgi:hypothetical protein